MNMFATSGVRGELLPEYQKLMVNSTLEQIVGGSETFLQKKLMVRKCIILRQEVLDYFNRNKNRYFSEGRCDIILFHVPIGNHAHEMRIIQNM